MPGEFDLSLYNGFSPTCSFKRISYNVSGGSTNSELVKNCTYLVNRKILIFLSADDRNLRTYDLTI